ncbi:MAG: EI24 domain-containing protein [Minwuia sp.]|uniref:EI24 domain-containing protein n=1 Tax=Minwuia sp. TaxID=2493630 RepID=UPI003A850A43
MIGLVINGALKGFGQLAADGQLRSVMWRSLLFAMVAVVLALIAAYFITDYVLVTYLGWVEGWLINVADVGATIGVGGLMYILFPAIVTGIASLFLDRAAQVVELRHYPADLPGQEPPMGPAIWNAVQFTALVMVVNIVLVPLYLVGIFFPPILLLIFLVNGWLLGREYFELVAYRHLKPGEVYDARRRNSASVLLGGIAIALGFTIPFLNLLVPVVGVAMMVHIFKGLQRRGKLPPADGGLVRKGA